MACQLFLCFPLPCKHTCPPTLAACAVGCQFFLCWLLYFYTASAMRESVLKVNGSHIRPWCAQPVTGTSCQVAASRWQLGEAGFAALAQAEMRGRRTTPPQNTATGLTRRLIRRPALLPAPPPLQPPQVDPPPLLVHRHRHAHAVAAG